MIDAALTMRSALKSWNNEMSGMTVRPHADHAEGQEWQYDVLLDVQHRLGLHTKRSESEQRMSGAEVNSENIRYATLTDGAKLVSGLASRGSNWAQPVRFVIAQAIFIIIVTNFRRWWANRRHTKVL